MSSYKRWFPPLVTVDDTAIAIGLALGGRYHYRRDEKSQEKKELQTWEAEGGNPAPRKVASQSS